MMIKFEYLTDPFEIKGGLQALVIENKPLYRRVTETFHNDTAGDLFVLSENFTPIDMKNRSATSGIFLIFLILIES